MNIQEFPLAWRWTHGKHAQLPLDVLSQMVPLSPEVARAAFTRGQNLRVTQGATHSAEISNSEGREWLRSQHDCQSDMVTIAWSFGWALRTTWGIYTEYWDSFCYPSSDDVLIFPESEQWVLYYDHEEQFEFIRQAHPHHQTNDSR